MYLILDKLNQFTTDGLQADLTSILILMWKKGWRGLLRVKAER